MLSQYRNRFDSSILSVFKQALQISLRNSRRFTFFSTAGVAQARAAKLRKRHLITGLQVPPLLIISITKRCNLNCTGCYSKILHQDNQSELSPERFREILNEASTLGVSIILLAGGEPLVRRDILEVAAEFPRIIFPIFSNGTLLDDSYLSFFYKHQHLIPVISLEGRELETDARRGDGIYQNYLQLVPKLKQHKLFWGSSFTLTRENYNQVLSHEFLSAQLALGAELYFLVEYVPIASGTESLVLSSWQKENVTRRVDRLNKDLPGIFIAFPGDEEQYGGCLAAGRGFLHVNPFGLAEACPFAPVSDVNLSFSTLREALSSRLMEKIRQNHSLLKEGEGGCALWANREFLQELSREDREA